MENNSYKEIIAEKDRQIETLKVCTNLQLMISLRTHHDIIQDLLQRRKEKNKLHVEQIGKFYKSQLSQILSTSDMSYVNNKLQSGQVTYL